MKKKIFIAAAVIFSSHAQAQQDTTGKTLDEVIITANKFPQKQSETGKVVTIITREQLQKSFGKTLSCIPALHPPGYKRMHKRNWHRSARSGRYNYM